LFGYGTSISAASGATRRSVRRKARARSARSEPTFTIGTISQSGCSAASSPLRPYEMPPHSSTGAFRGSRPWMVSQTSVPMTPIRRLEAAKVLHLECGDGSHHAGGAGKHAGHDARGVHSRPEGASPHLGAERREERVTGRRHAAGHHHHVGVENIEKIGDAHAEVARRV